MSKKNLFPPLAALLVAGLLVSTFVGCDDPGKPDFPRLDRAPHPDSGYEFLLGAGYGFSLGLTMAALDSLWTVWPAELRVAAEQATPEARRRMTYDRYGLLEGVSDVAGRSPDVPLNFNEDPTTGALKINCLICHAGKVVGRVVPGMNNTHVALLTFTNDLILYLATAWIERHRNRGLATVDTLGQQPPQTVEDLAILVHRAKGEAESKGIALDPMHSMWEGFVDVVVGGLEDFLEEDTAGRDSLLTDLLGRGVIAHLVEGFVRFRAPVLSNTDGTSNAFFLAAQLGTFRVGSGAKSPDLTRLPRRDIPPYTQWATETPAWFNSRKKKLYYHDGFIEDTPGDLMQFLMGPVTTGAFIRDWYPQFQDLLAWMWATDPPTWPEDTLGVIDRDLARTGLLVFTNHCAQCHGFYGAGGGSYTDAWRNQDVVRTDSMRLVGMGKTYRAFLRDSFFGADGTGPGGKAITILEPLGYVAPPLDGIWATPPYFHNGAVPTLMDVLNYDDRPKIWTRSEDGYDPIDVGLEIQAYTALPDSVTEGWERRMFYQDALTGKKVGGHAFPALPQALTDAEKRALVEYLKTL